MAGTNDEGAGLRAAASRPSLADGSLILTGSPVGIEMFSEVQQWTSLWMSLFLVSSTPGGRCHGAYRGWPAGRGVDPANGALPAPQSFLVLALN